MDLAKPKVALYAFGVAWKTRERVLGSENAFTASSYDNLGLAYTELNMLSNAYEYHEKAIMIRLETKSDRIGNSYSNMASLLLRMGKPDEAEEMLARCPALKDFSDESFLATGNPRFASDMMLLARIRREQGQLGDAIRLAVKALAVRKEVHGNGLKTCDALYLLADL